MRAQIIKIGNSQGIRIPKIILEQTGLKGEVELAVKDNKIIIQSIDAPRKDWEAAFQKMAVNKDDKFIDEEITTKWDREEWDW
jgi:antitoxin MazE